MWRLAAALTTAQADWQIHAYVATMHAFMAEGVDLPEHSLQYNARSAQRAWNAWLGARRSVRIGRYFASTSACASFSVSAGPASAGSLDAARTSHT